MCYNTNRIFLSKRNIKQIYLACSDFQNGCLIPQSGETVDFFGKL